MPYPSQGANISEIAFDLTKVADELSRSGKYKDLVIAFRRASSTASAYQDLQIATESLQLLRRLTISDESSANFSIDETGVLAGSLFNNAIILYARATETKPIGRQKWFGIEKVPTAHRLTHKTVMLIRNKELAHFGTGMPVDGTPMLEEALVMVDHGHTISIGFRANRSHNRGQFAADFSSLAEIITEVARQTTVTQIEVAQQILGPLVGRDISLNSLIQQYPLADDLRSGAHSTAKLEPGVSSETYAQTIAVKIPNNSSNTADKQS
jgi:hypothetical protein